MLYCVFPFNEELCCGCWKLSFLVVIQGRGVPKLTQRNHEDQWWSCNWAFGPWDLAPQRGVKRFAAQGHLQPLFRFWRVLRCRKQQRKLPFLCVWLWVFRYLVLSFSMPPNYYFCFPFKNSLSKLIWLIIVSSPVKLALLKHNAFLIWSLSCLDLHLSGYWFLLRNQFFPLSLSTEGWPGIPLIQALQLFDPGISKSVPESLVWGCAGFFALRAWFGETVRVGVVQVWVAGHKPDSVCELAD